MLSIALVYAFSYGIYGAVIPFLPVILREQGFSDGEIGAILSAFGFAASLAPLVLSHVADRHEKPKRVLSLLLFAVSFVIPLWLWASSSVASFFVTFTFFAMLVPVLSFLDSYTLRFLHESGRDPHSLPRLRVWGSVGFILPSLVLLWLQMRGTFPASSVLPVGAVCSLVAALCATRLPDLELNAAPARFPSVAALEFVWSGDLRPLFAMTALAGISLSIFYIALPRALQELGLSAGQIGIVSNIGVLSEVCLIPFIPALIRRIGADYVVLLAVGALCLRLAILGMTESVPLICATQVLHSIIVAGFLITPPLILARHADSSFRFSIQSLYTFLNVGITRVFGAWLLSFSMSIAATTRLAALHRIMSIAAVIALGATLLWSIALVRRAREGREHAET